MESCTLSGRSILIAEDEPLIALDIAEAFKRVGAAIVVTSTVQHALVLVEHDDLSAYRVVRRRQRPRPTRSRSSLKPVSGRRRSRDGWMWAGRASIERSAIRLRAPCKCPNAALHSVPLQTVSEGRDRSEAEDQSRGEWDWSSSLRASTNIKRAPVRGRTGRPLKRRQSGGLELALSSARERKWLRFRASLGQVKQNLGS